jgi:signal transduction histidine kinase
MIRLYFFLTLFLTYFYAQANKDSLILFSLLEQAKQTENTDSSESFANEAMAFATSQNYLDGVLSVAKYFGNQYAKTGELEKSLSFYKSLVIEHKFDTKQLSTAYNQIGIYHVYMGHYDSTEVYFLKALKMRQQLNDSLGMGASLNNLGNVVLSKGDYDKATEYFIKALKIREQINDTAGIASSVNNLGMIFYKQRNFKEAIVYYQRALELNQQQNNLSKEGFILLNLGNIYDEMGVLDSSVYYYQKAIIVAEEFGDARLMAMSYGNMGVTQQNLSHYDLAKSYINKALKIRLESEDLEGQAILYNNLGGIFNKTLQLDSAIIFFKKSLSLAKQIDFKETVRDNYLGLSVAYESLNQFEKAYSSYQEYTFIKDSMLNETTTEQIAEINTKYETEKKEKEIAKQKVNIAEQDLKMKQRNFLLLGLLLLLLFLVSSGYFIYKQQKQKQLRLIEENRLKDEIAQVIIQNELHEERLRISRDLHDNIGSQLTFIISSVDNMKHLFKSADEKLNTKLSDVSNFTRTTITQLRDTIWALNKDEINFDDLKSRLFNYIENAQLAQEQTEFIFKDDLTSKFTLNSIQGVSIYRIVQEALNNTMKYAAATNVVLTIAESEKNVTLLIKDDGVGFNMPEIQLGNGLENMKNRAAEINAEFEILSTLNEGTEILLTLPKRVLN